MQEGIANTTTGEHIQGVERMNKVSSERERVSHKRRRYTEGWAVEFPPGSDWRDDRRLLKEMAVSRDVGVGVILQEAMKYYIKDHYHRDGKRK